MVGGTIGLFAGRGLTVSGNLSVDGGSIPEGGTGSSGRGGEILLSVLPGSGAFPLNTLGYDRFVTQGGFARRAGNGGPLTIVATGEVSTIEVKDVKFVCQGGMGSDESGRYGGGKGGTVAFVAEESDISLTGDVLASGGDDTKIAGSGGNIKLQGKNVTVTSVLDVSGADANPDETDSSGGNGGTICLPEDADIGTTADLVISGGLGELPGEEGTVGTCP